MVPDERVRSAPLLRSFNSDCRACNGNCAVVGLMQSFRFVEKRWCLHVDINTPGDAFLPQNNMLTRQRDAECFLSRVFGSE